MSKIPSPSSAPPIDRAALEHVAAELHGPSLKRNVPLAPFTTFKIGGPADLLYEADTADDLAHAIVTARKAQVPYFVLGLGANVLIADKGVRGLVIRNVATHSIFHDDGRLWVERGAGRSRVARNSSCPGWGGRADYRGRG